MNDSFPKFDNRASCADYDPEWWFPQEKGGNHKRWTRTPDALKAREICLSCPARKECKDYAIKYDRIYGIWAGQDWYEREAEQKALRMETTNFRSTFAEVIQIGKARQADE